MRKILLTTTALVALGSVAAVAADVSISGNTRFRYQSWSDDNAAVAGENNNSMSDILQLWVRSSATTDSGLTIGTNSRIRSDAVVDRNWIDIDGDFGKIDLGEQWSLAYSGSLHEIWVGTVAGGGYMGGSTNAGLLAMNRSGFMSGTTNPKINYHLPSIGGFNAAIGFEDAGSTSDADQTDIHLRYDMPMADGTLRLNMNSNSTNGADATAAESDAREIGVQYSGGFGRVYALQQNMETTTIAGVKTSDLEGTTFGGTYNMGATNLVYYRQENDQDGTTGLGDSFSSDTIGVRYNIAGGLRVGLLHSNYDYTDADNAATSENGSGTRLEVRMDF